MRTMKDIFGRTLIVLKMSSYGTISPRLFQSQKNFIKPHTQCSALWWSGHFDFLYIKYGQWMSIYDVAPCIMMLEMTCGELLLKCQHDKKLFINNFMLGNMFDRNLVWCFAKAIITQCLHQMLMMWWWYKKEDPISNIFSCQGPGAFLWWQS